MASPKPRKNLKQFGKFEIIERLGVGGMGSVYKAHHPDFAAPFALKIAHVAVAEDATLSQRFQKEHSIGVKLSHPNLVKVLDYGVQEDLPYLVLEYVPGCNLHEYISRNGALSTSEAIDLFHHVTRVVQFIHDRNLVHRDIKPGNLLIDPSGMVKLTDLGLIKDIDSSDCLTHSRASLGTPDYGAPEQFEDAAKVDLRCDIFALGVTLYFALTGAFPFGRAVQAIVMRRKLSFEFTPLSEILARVGKGIDQTVNRALHPDPNRRPASAVEFMQGLLEQNKHSGRELMPRSHPAQRSRKRERRVVQRYPITISQAKVSIGGIEGTDASIVNLSSNGLCLSSTRAFSVGAHLTIDLPEDGPQVEARARVCWIQQVLNGRWLMGCNLNPTMSNEQLQDILSTYLPKTQLTDKTLC